MQDARKRVFDEPFAVKEGVVKSVAFSPDGKTIAAGYVHVPFGNTPTAATGGVVLWDVAARARFDEPIAVNEDGVWSVAFSPDGKTIAAACGRGGSVLLDVDAESWKRRAGQIANRNFSGKEWRQYFPEEPFQATLPDFPIPQEATPK